MRRGTTTTALRTEAVLRRLSTEGTATTRGRRRPLRSVVLLTREWLRGGGGSGGGGLGGRGVSSQEESWKGVENFRGSLCKERSQHPYSGKKFQLTHHQYRRRRRRRRHGLNDPPERDEVLHPLCSDVADLPRLLHRCPTERCPAVLGQAQPRRPRLRGAAPALAAAAATTGTAIAAALGKLSASFPGLCA